MAPGGTLFRFAPHFGENVLPHGSHEWLPYSVIPAFSKQIGKHQFVVLSGEPDKHFTILGRGGIVPARPNAIQLFRGDA